MNTYLLRNSHMRTMQRFQNLPRMCLLSTRYSLCFRCESQMSQRCTLCSSFGRCCFGTFQRSTRNICCIQTLTKMFPLDNLRIPQSPDWLLTSLPCTPRTAPYPARTGIFLESTRKNSSLPPLLDPEGTTSTLPIQQTQTTQPSSRRNLTTRLILSLRGTSQRDSSRTLTGLQQAGICLVRMWCSCLNPEYWKTNPSCNSGMKLTMSRLIQSNIFLTSNSCTADCL